MFEQVLGLPAHPLLVHAAVVFVPLLALAALTYALVRPLRRHIRWAVVLLALAAPGAAVFAKLSGDAFRNRLIARDLVSEDILEKVAEHQKYGDLAMWVAIALGVVTLALALTVVAGPPRGPGTGGPDGAHRSASGRLTSTVLEIALGVAAVGLAAAALFYVYQTGDSGARVVWDGF